METAHSTYFTATPLLYLSFLCHPYILTIILENFYSFLYTFIGIEVYAYHAVVARFAVMVYINYSIGGGPRYHCTIYICTDPSPISSIWG